MDLWRYYAVDILEAGPEVGLNVVKNTLEPGYTTAPYFSLNNGFTNQGAGLWNDAGGNWLAGNPVPNDAFGAGGPGVLAPISSEDIVLMTALGWDSAAAVSGGTVSSGGSLSVSSGGTASGATVDDGGYQYVAAGGIASDTVLTDPGIQVVSSGGIAIGATLSGGKQDVYGLASGTVVDSSGLEIVESGGTASDATIGSGGTIDVLDGGSLTGNVANNGTVDFDITGSATFGGTLIGSGALDVSGGGALDVASAYTGSAQVDDASTLEFASTYVGAASFSGAPTGPGGTLKLDTGSTGPILVVNPNDTVIAQPGSDNWINAAATGNSHNDTFVVYDSADTVIGQAGSTDTVYSAANFTPPTNVDTLFLEGPSAILGTGNNDAVDALFGNAGVASTLVAGRSGRYPVCDRHRRHHADRRRRRRHLCVPQHHGQRRGHQFRHRQGHAAVQRHAVFELHRGDERCQPGRGQYGVHYRRQRHRDARQRHQEQPHGGELPFHIGVASRPRHSPTAGLRSGDPGYSGFSTP